MTVIPDEQFYQKEIRDPQTHLWPYKATLADTRLTLYSQDSIEEAVGSVQQAIIQAFTGSYQPVILSYRSAIAILSRDPVSHIALDVIDLSPWDGISLHSVPRQLGGYIDWNEALMDARRMLARRTWDGKEEESARLRDYPADQEQFGRWARARKGAQNTSAP